MTRLHDNLVGKTLWADQTRWIIRLRPVLKHDLNTVVQAQAQAKFKHC